MLWFLLGRPLGHSYSPVIFRNIFDITGISGKYFAVEIPTRNMFFNFVRESLCSGVSGINVTLPYKTDAFVYAEKKSSITLKTGSANLLYTDKDGNICCDNTDYAGFLKTVENKEIIYGREHVIIGTGGVARTIAVALSDAGASKILILARNREKAQNFVSEISQKIDSKIEVLELGPGQDLRPGMVVNATPAGMSPETEVIPFGLEKLLQSIKEKTLYYDLIYNPRETKAMKMFKAKGHDVRNGFDMLVYQALKAFEIVADKKIDSKKLFSKLKENGY